MRPTPTSSSTPFRPITTARSTKVAVRQALAYAIDRSRLIQDNGGPQVAPPLTQILPAGINGSAPAYNPYPLDTTKAKSTLSAAGATGLTLKLLYRPVRSTQISRSPELMSNIG